MQTHPCREQLVAVVGEDTAFGGQVGADVHEGGSM